MEPIGKPQVLVSVTSLLHVRSIRSVRKGSEQMTVGFIGLGNLGSAMVRRLNAEGVEVRVWNRSPAKALALGLQMVPTPAALVSCADIVMLNLFDSEAVESVLTMPSGVFEGACRTKTLLDTTTHHPTAVLRIHDLVAQHGAYYLEGPVLGSVKPALDGALTMVVSGRGDVLSAATPLISKLCRKVFHFPVPGQATRMKLANNLVLGTFMAALADATAIAERSGISRGEALDVLANGAGNSSILNAKKDRLLGEEFPAQFTCHAILKDLNYLHELLGDIPPASVLNEATRQLYGQAVDAGFGELDFSSVIKVLG
jgi:3-hydroxyisobutyrate dehydrogenase